MADLKVCDHCGETIRVMYFHVDRECEFGSVAVPMGMKTEYDIHYECIGSWGSEQQRRYEERGRPKDYKRGGPV